MQGGKARIEGPALPLFLGKLRRYEYVYVIYRGRYNPKVLPCEREEATLYNYAMDYDPRKPLHGVAGRRV